MCLAAAYQGHDSDQPILREIARISLANGMIELETLFGERKAIQGKVTEIDFMNSRVTIEP
jgi:predicted RNA-binding protein